jgi:CheY-like chemotaxis protein
MLDLLQQSLGPQIEIDLRFPRRLAPANVDANQLELAVLNLAVNGRDAMPSGGRLMLSAREEHVSENANDLRPGDYIVVAVSDSGEGMDDETLRRAAEPFFTTKGVGKGTGLGLSMVHGLAAQSGGRLVLKSQREIGTTAELWLPKATVAAAPMPAVVRPPYVNIDARRVMIVDDDPLVLAGTADLLEDLGHEVVEASSGRQALEILRAEARIDLVITDHAMPGMTGVELFTRAREAHPDLPFILATGYAELPDLLEAPTIRLSKPFKQDALAQAIGQALRSTAMPSNNIFPFRR